MHIFCGFARVVAAMLTIWLVAVVVFFTWWKSELWRLEDAFSSEESGDLLMYSRCGVIFVLRESDRMLSSLE